MKRFLLVSVAALAILTVQARAGTLVVFYSFNTNGYAGTMGDSGMTNYVETPNVDLTSSSFSISNSQATPLVTILSSVSGGANNHGYTAGNSVGMNGFNGGASYFQFTLDATGYQDLVLAWAGNRSSTGPTTLTLRYSTTGVNGTFTDFSTITSLANYTTTQDVSSVASLDNNPNDVFRLVGNDPGNTSGTLKIDNFSIEGTPVAVPEPSTMALIGFSLVGGMAFARRRVSRK